MNRSESYRSDGEDEAATETESNFGVVTDVALAAAAAIGIAGAVFGFGSSSSSSDGEDEAAPKPESNFGVATGAALAAAAAIGTARLFRSSSSSYSSETRKIMKAPGKNGEIMYRDDFEKDPQDYFNRLNKKDPQGTVLGSGSSFSSSTRKTMKAPGKNGEIMYRDDFEKDPQDYFNRLHKKDSQGDVLGFNSSSSSSSFSSETRKTMKAPGKKGQTMFRQEFERDPEGYFRDLRNNKRHE